MANGVKDAEVVATGMVVAKATSAAEWGVDVEDGLYYTLPGSGKVAKLRRPGLMGLVTEGGTVPNPLSVEIMRFLADNSDSFRTMTPKERIDVFQKNVEAFADIARLCFVEPKVAPKGKAADRSKGEINPRDITDYDYSWLVYSFVEGSVDRIKDFRLG